MMARPEQPTVSVVMAVHDGEAFLAEAIDSVLDQTFADFEFVIVDDGSSDATPAILRRYQASDTRVRVHRQPNRGLIASLNTGCELARGAYIARMDADDVALPDRLALQVQFLDRNPNVALVAGAVCFIGSDGVQIHRYACPTDHAELAAALMRSNCLTHPAVVMRARAFRDLGGYRPAFLHAEDYDLFLRMAGRYEIAAIPESVLHYRLHTNQISVRNVVQQAFSALAAQACARFRLEDLAEPFPIDKGITREVLHRLGISDEAIQKELVRRYCGGAEWLVSLGREAEALHLLGSAVPAVRATSQWKSAAGALYWRQAKRSYVQGGFASWIPAALRAFRAEPVKLINRVVRYAGRRARAAGG